MSDETWSFAQKFYADFQSQRADLTARADTLKASSSASTATADVLHGLAAAISRLSKSLTDATGALPSYDQRQCELQLKDLQSSFEDIRAASAPKSKFAFKRKTATEAVGQSGAAPSTGGNIVPMPPSALSPVVVDASSSSAFKSLTISSQSERVLSLDTLFELSPSLDASEVSINDVKNCLVSLLPTQTHRMQLSAIHAKHLTNVVLVLPKTNGSVLLYELTNCTVVTECHQFRMHDSRDVDIYISCPNNMIMEDCTRIRFATHPDSISPGGDSTQLNRHFTVQDFSHIRPTASPNWAAMPEWKGTIDWPFSHVDESRLERALDKLLPLSRLNNKQ